MKKRFFISILLTAFFVLPVSAFEHGPVIGGGVVGAIKPYAYESLAYKLDWDYVDIDFGVRVLENILYNQNEPLISLEPGINIYFGSNKASYYIGGGFFVTPGFSSEIAGYARTGGVFGGWDWGIGKGSLDIGLEMSPTICYIEGDDELESGLSSVIGTIFNILKLNLGVTYFIPVGK